MPFSCYIIGHGSLTLDCLKMIAAANHHVLGVQSTHPDTLGYCLEHSIPVLDSMDSVQAAMTAKTADYLFSIINPNLIPRAVLALANGAAINFHDSPLPRYAGLNAVSWAVQNQETDYGITWHIMSEQFDAGDVLVQPRFELDPDETAFTLALRCHSEGLASFKVLIDNLASGSLQSVPQSATQGSVYLGKHRPVDAAILNWHNSARQNAALVRGLSFGSEINPLGFAKLQIQQSFYQVSSAQVCTDTPASGTPGEIAALTVKNLDIATTDGTLRILELKTLDGQPLYPEDVARRHSLHIGQKLELLTPTQSGVLNDLSKTLTANEGYWRDLLVAETPIAPFDVHRTDQADVSNLESLPIPGPTLALLDAAFAGSVNQSQALAALYHCFLAKLQSSTAVDDDVWLSQMVSISDATYANLCSQLVPTSVRVDRKKAVNDLVADIAQQLDSQLSKGTFWVDLPNRIRVPTPSRQIAIAIDAKPVTPESWQGVALVLQTNTALTQHEFIVDTTCLSIEMAQRHCSLFFDFVNNALQNSSTALEHCQLLTGAERERVLKQWNATDARQAEPFNYPDLIERQVAKNPEATALVYGDTAITYKALSLQARQVAQGLLDVGVDSQSLVGVHLHRSIDMVVALIGIGYAGAAYVPLDPSYPADRIALMIEDAKLRHIICANSSRPPNSESVAQLLTVEELRSGALTVSESPAISEASDLAYVIYTSGSTGKPKGVMVEHGNLNNFLVGMDDVLDYQGNPGVWLAVTSISFDISVLELIWTLTRGFKVVVQPDNLTSRQLQKQTRSNKPVDYSLFYFSSDAGPTTATADSTSAQQQGRYRLLLEGAKFADQHDFSAIWTPERHFHLFGGLYPNPSVTSAAVAAVTKNIGIRAGSIVLPLHHPVRVAEEWSVVDNVSNGRVGFSFASGWHANDFALKPENYEDRKQIMFDGIETVLKLWSGDSLTFTSGDDKPFTARVFPPPVQEKPPIWITAAGSPETFKAAGSSGHNLLTNLLGQSVAELQGKIETYRSARAEAGYTTPGTVSLMLHTFIGEDVEQVRAIVKEPFCHYLKTSFDLVKIAPWAFPAFSQPSKSMSQDPSLDTSVFTDEDLDALVEHAFDRYFETAGLFGTPQSVLPLVDQLKEAGVTEFACLVDFGVDEAAVLTSLESLNRLRLASQPERLEATATPSMVPANYSLSEQLSRHKVTHFQCTPSMARLLWNEQHDGADLEHLQHVLLGGEALPLDLANRVANAISSRLVNVYGPTETTIWSTASVIEASDSAPSIGRPIANTQVYILDGDGQPLPAGVAGELCIGGAGVVRGYLDRPELTAEKFVSNPFGAAGDALYRTGDLAAWREDGTLEFLGRLDHQVKLRGYRIELGEIEQAINDHPAIAESVVIAQKNDNEDTQLTAYIVSAGADTAANTVASWRDSWSDAYSSADSSNDQTIMNTAGWLNSFSGEQHRQEDMQEWVATTCKRVLERKPGRVLEIGCGTGMLLFQIAPECEHYLGTDISEVALQSIRGQLADRDLSNVSLKHCAADQLSDLGALTFDLIVLNSVSQYFPSGSYLIAVIESALQLLAPGGELFIGDVRSMNHLQLFHETVERHRAIDADSVSDFRSRVQLRSEKESELVCDPRFFSSLSGLLPGIDGYNIRLKDAAAHNEMSMFRYDVLLKKAGGDCNGSPSWQTVQAAASPEIASIDELVTRLKHSNGPIEITGLANARLVEPMRFAKALESADTSALLPTLCSTPDIEPSSAIDPNALQALVPDMNLEFRWGDPEKPGEMTVRARTMTSEPDREPFWDTEQAVTPSAQAVLEYCNQPATRNDDQSLSEQLKKHLARTLPDFMIPADVVLLSALPLTPNGKVDRKQLPAPQRSSAARSEVFVAPGNVLEQQIADVFAAMLNTTEIGIHDNFFDAGANSLLIVQANSRLSKLLDRKVPLVSMYRFPTVASLASQLDGTTASEQNVATKAVSRAQRRKQARAGRRRSPAK